MEKEQLPKTKFFTEEEWDLTRSGVKNFVVQQKSRIEELEVVCLVKTLVF